MAQTQTAKPVQPEFSLTFDDAIVGWNVSQTEWLKNNQKTWDALATGAMVFDPQDRLLLVKRAAHDSMPNLWEVPGGAVDDEDPTIFFACARELWEEAGLIARRVKHVIAEGPDVEPGSVFSDRSGKRFYCKFCFEVEVDGEQQVRLDPDEHQDYVWVTEEEARLCKQGDKELPMITQQMNRLVAEAFRLRRLTKKEEERSAL